MVISLRPPAFCSRCPHASCCATARKPRIHGYHRTRLSKTALPGSPFSGGRRLFLPAPFAQGKVAAQQDKGNTEELPHIQP